MIATALLLFFLLFIPPSFQKRGRDCILQQNRMGALLILFSKALWWGTVAFLLLIWLPDYGLLIGTGCLLGGSLTCYMDRKYFRLQKKN